MPLWIHNKAARQRPKLTVRNFDTGRNTIGIAMIIVFAAMPEVDLLHNAARERVEQCRFIFGVVGRCKHEFLPAVLAIPTRAPSIIGFAQSRCVDVDHRVLSALACPRTALVWFT